MISKTWDALLAILLGEDRTTWLERFFAYTSVICGLWLLWPFFGRVFFAPTAISRVPQWVTGSILLAHGIVYSFALGRTPHLGLCQRGALANAAIWGGITLGYVLTPPRTLLIVPLVSSIATASFLVFLRLRLLFHEP